MKRLTSMFFVFLFLASVPNFASAKPLPTMDGQWNVTGKTSVTGSIPSVISLNVTFLKNKDIHDTWNFESGTVTSNAAGVIGPYATQKNGSAVIDITEELNKVKSSLLAQLPAGSTVTYNKQIFNMKPTGTTKAIGTFILEVQVNTFVNEKPVVVVVKLNSTLSGDKVIAGENPAKPAGDALESISTYIMKKAVQPLLLLMDKGELQKRLTKPMVK